MIDCPQHVQSNEINISLVIQFTDQILLKDLTNNNFYLK